MQMFLKEKQQHFVSLTYDNFKEDACELVFRT